MKTISLPVRILICLLAIALVMFSAAGVVMRRDGLTLEDMWSRKKAFIRTASPEAGEAVESVERVVRPQ